VAIDKKLVQADEAARVEALNVEQSYIVQAPAGSGKTELLIQRYLKLLATVEHPEEVLAITFTRKAAAEMQFRVLQALKQSARNKVPSEPYEQVTATAATAVLRRDIESGWDLIANPRRMRIQTLDSLNASIARTQPLTSASGAAGNAIIADAQMRALYRSAAALTLDQLTESGDLHDATEQVLSHVDNNTSLYVTYVARMIATRDQWLPFVGSGVISRSDAVQLRRRFEDSLQEIVAQHLEKLHTVFPKVFDATLVELGAYAAEQLHEEGQSEVPIAALSEVAGFPDATAESFPLWSGFADLLLTQKGEWRKRLNKNQGFPAGDKERKQAMEGLLESVRDEAQCRLLLHEIRALPPVCYSDEQWSILLALFRLLPIAVTELKRLFCERGVSDHTEISLCASDALGTADQPGDIALLLDYQIRHLLVDEMQDTSSAQYRMLEALTGGWERGDGRTLFCVGDPMQSIYRFRNAEVGQFLLAQRGGIGGVQLGALVLRQNFRSGEKLVDWFNELFPNVLPAADDPQRSAVSYTPAVAVPKFAQQGACVSYPLFGSSADAEADRGCEVIRATLAANPDDEMAVLVRSRTQLPGLLARLRKAGIAYRAVEIDRLTDLPEIIDILALTRALVHQGDRLAWLALLRSPWLGLDWTDLQSLVKSDTRHTIWELMHDDDRVKGLSPFGKKAILEFRGKLATAMAAGRLLTLRDRLEKTWLGLGGAAILDDQHVIQNIYRYLDVIEKLDVAGSLPDVAELEATLDLEHVSSDVNARLQVMTMHRAKGLQFDHVLLYGLGRIPRPREQTLLSWFDIPNEHGDPQKIISPVGARAEVENDPIYRYIGIIESEKDRNELGRLLYVACTRARKSLHLLGHVRVTKDKFQADARSLLSLLWPIVADQYAQAFDPDAQIADEDGDQGWLLPVLRRFETPWTPPQPVPIPGGAAVPAIADQDDRSVEFYWVGSAARFAGTIVHRWLNMASEGRVKLDAGNLAATRPASERWLREMGVGPESITAIVTRIDEALRNITSDEKGRWLLHGEGYSELALSGVLNGQIESVVLDRVRIDEAGIHWIVDYKTSSHEGGNLAGFLSAETDRYRPQLRKYAELYRNYSNATVRCALYFPLLQEFVEVEA